MNVKKICHRFVLFPVTLLMVSSLTGCGITVKERENVSDDNSNLLYVYNWGEYLDPDVIDLFEEETGYKVIYDVFETNEVMYPKVAADPSQYDVLCPSDYMIAKMSEEGLLAELNMEEMPEAKKEYRKGILGNVQKFRSEKQVFRSLLLGNRRHSV